MSNSRSPLPGGGPSETSGRARSANSESRAWRVALRRWPDGAIMSLVPSAGRAGRDRVRYAARPLAPHGSPDGGNVQLAQAALRVAAIGEAPAPGARAARDTGDH